MLLIYSIESSITIYPLDSPSFKSTCFFFLLWASLDLLVEFDFLLVLNPNWSSYYSSRSIYLVLFLLLNLEFLLVLLLSFCTDGLAYDFLLESLLSLSTYSSSDSFHFFILLSLSLGRRGKVGLIGVLA